MGVLSGKTAVITGATGGIGKSIALAFAAEGVGLCLLGRERGRLQALAQELTAFNPAIRIALYPLDLAKIGDVEATCNEIIGSNTAIDLLIHSAGTLVMKNYELTTGEDFDTQYFINVKAPFFLTQWLLPSIKRQKGQVVFINSSASQQKAKAGVAAYAASKYALTAVADSLRDAVNESGVRVLSIYPGRTATGMQEKIYEIENRDYHGERLLQPDDIAKTVITALSMPGTAEITDISIRPFLKG